MNTKTEKPKFFGTKTEKPIYKIAKKRETENPNASFSKFILPLLSVKFSLVSKVLSVKFSLVSKVPV